jgi:acetone carboxylase gamma subunit
MNMRVSESLTIKAGGICCVSCGHRLVRAGVSWKNHAALQTVPVNSLPGAASAIEPRVVLRHFSCPKCAALLDTETAMPDDPFLEDVLFDGGS